MEKIRKLLKKVPILAAGFRTIRYLYNRYPIKRKWKSLYLNKSAHLFHISSSKKFNSFFGYYNISPFNSKGDILFCETSTQKVRGSLEEELEIKIFMSEINKAKKITKTKSWNWQQGCMLQWYANSDDKIIYNCYSEQVKQYYSEILNIKTGNRKKLCMPIYSVSDDGSFFLTLNFDRLAEMRPDYGYFNKKYSVIPNNDKDGIWKIDIEKNISQLILSLDDLIKFKPASSMKNSRHKVNHVDIAPDGKRFMFLHRWIGQDGRFMRLLTANTDGSGLFYVTGDDMVSHNCWWGNKNIISFCRMSDGKNRYVHFKDKVGYIEPIGVNDFSCDGHPSISPNGKWMLTDDYPDKARFSRVYLYDLEKKAKHIVGAFYQPLKYQGEKRIDLHPKWSRDGKYVSIDSGHNWRRNFIVIDVSGIVIDA